MKVRFKPDNNIVYGQDHGFGRGIPDGVWFDITPMPEASLFTKHLYVLRAPGYGGEPYGNGALFVKYVWQDETK